LALNVYKGSSDYRGPACVLTIGNFDGVHLGHQALIRKNQKKAKELGVASVLYTFEPHPRRVLQPQNHPPRLLGLKEKLALIEQMGIEHVVVESFNEVFALQPADWFAREVIQKRLGAQALVVGHDFRFGRGREGTAEGLKERLPDLAIETLKAVLVDDTVASSSRVREWIANGNVDGAAKLLGRPYSIQGRVVPGSARGRELGFPTANIDSHNELMPKRGVYAVQVELAGQQVDGVANLGVRPTFGDHLFCIEVHLMDRKEDLYDQQLSVEFIQNIREEKKFESVDDLKKQIQADVDLARRILGS